MSNNPFESISDKLEKQNALLNEVLELVRKKPDAVEVGGPELAQEVTRLSKARIYALVSACMIPHSKRGNKLYFNRTDLLAWVAKGKRANNEG
jgi:hypothetical protein